MKKFCIWTKRLYVTWTGNLMTRQNWQLWHNYCKVYQVRGRCSHSDDTGNHMGLSQYKRYTQAMKTRGGVKTKHSTGQLPGVARTLKSLFELKSILFTWALQPENQLGQLFYQKGFIFKVETDWGEKAKHWDSINSLRTRKSFRKPNKGKENTEVG